MRRPSSSAVSAALVLAILLCAPHASASDAGIFQGAIAGNRLKEGNVTFADIPNMIVAATNFILGLAGTASVAAIIFGAFKLVLGSGALGGKAEGKTDAKHAIEYGITGFVIAVSAWLMVRLVLSNL